MAKPKIIIEHLEPKLSRWLYIEYRHVSTIVGKDGLVFTNVKDENAFKTLSSLGTVYKESIIELEDSFPDLIVLDPKALYPLKPHEIEENTAIIIGGILGDHPPKGRTWRLLTSKLKKARPRNIGKYQFSIDGAAYIAIKVAEGLNLSGIPITVNLKIAIEEYPGIIHEIMLPYAYPLVNGKPLISKELLSYLRRGIVFDELRELEALG